MERQFLRTFFILFFLVGCQQFEINKLETSAKEKNLDSFKDTLYKNDEDISIWSYIKNHNNTDDDLVINDQVLSYMNMHLKDLDKFEEYLNDSYYFIYFVVNELEKNNLPIELAILPYIESNYDPFSISSSGAVGLWQLMPTTGKIYNLEKTWWVEGRHDPIESTKAAVKYLAYLYNRFDRNPTLTLIAYHAGPTYLEKQIRILESRGREVSLSNLKLSKESFNYVPKFLAINKIIKDPYKYGINLPNLPNEKVIEKIQIEGQIEMLPFSEFSGVTPEFLYQLNAGYTKWATPPTTNTVLYLPIERLGTIEQDINNYFQENPIRWMTHNVSAGETLWDIAKLYDVAVDDLKLVNSKSNQSLLSINETLLVPLGDPKITTFIPYQTHIVSEGDTLWSLGRKYDIAPIEIARNNQLSINGVLSVGVALNIGTGNIARSMQAKKRSILYSVKQGDNLYKISELFNIEISEIMELNNLSSNDLSPGQILKLIISAI